MKNLQDLRIFLETARLGSLSACARQMNITPAVASAAIKRLEAELDALLFIRSTRSLRLTEQGERFLPQCQEALALLDDGVAALREQSNELSGQVRLSAPSDLGRNLLLPWLDAFMDAHPKVRLRLHLSDAPADLYSQSVDLAVRYGAPKDSSLIAVPLAPENQVILCAAPAYIQRFGSPKTPEELTQHNCLCLGHNDTLHTRWTFVRKNKEQNVETQQVEVTGNRDSKDGDAIRLWALAGKGIARKSRLDVIRELRTGALVEIDVGWQSENYPLNLMCAERRLMNATVQALKEHLAKCVQSLL